MANNHAVYHVVPNLNGSRWVVSRESDSHFREEYDTKEQAVRAAAARALMEEPANVKIHRGNGVVEYETSFGVKSRRSGG